MEQKEIENEQQVALLIADLEVARTISSIFKQIGIAPYIYNSLQDYWKGVLEDRPDLTVADVRLLSDGNLLLKDHPLIVDKSIEISFYWEKETAPLLVSTYDLHHHGLICRELPLTGQIKNVLMRFNEWSELRRKAEDESSQSKVLDKKINAVIHSSESLKEKAFYQKLLRSIIARFENRRDEHHFDQLVAQVFGTVQEITQYTIFELSRSGQKLVTSTLENEKFQHIPPLWLGKTCEDGIEFFAQNMASQVCVDLMGGELMSLCIQGVNQHPDRLIILKLKNEDVLAHFEWDMLESYMSGFYSHLKLRQQNSIIKTENQYLSPWQLYSLLDQGIRGKISAEGERLGSDRYLMIDISFDQMLFEIQSRNLRFHWEDFISNFFAGITRHKNIDFKLSFFGVNHAVCLVEKEMAEELFDFVKAYTSRFSFWRYFDEAELVLGKSLRPVISMVPSSITAYQRFLTQNEREESEMTSAPLITQRAPEQTM